MAERLLDKASFSLVRTNPKLTTNIKVVTNGDDIFLESFSANTELSSSTFKSFKVDAASTYDKDIHRFYQSGNFPKALAYDVYQQFRDTSVLSSYNSQYEMFYSAGTESISSEAHTEDIGMLAPLWLKEQVPNYFVIFRLNDPSAVNNVDALAALDGETDAQTAAKFSKFVLENCTAIKTFDLTSNSNIGRYIRNYREQNDFPIAPITATWRRDEPFQWNGISYKNGGFTSGGNFTYDDIVAKDATIIQNDYFFTQGFQRNGVILANLLNMQFLFNDKYAAEYSVNRYFGMYVDEVEEGTFELSGEGFYKGTEPEQTPKITTITEVSDQLNEELILSNERGNLIYTKDPQVITGYPTPKRVNEVESIFYVKDKLNEFHTIKKGGRWNSDNGEIRLFDKKIDISLLTGYRKPDSFASATIISPLAKALCTFKILDEVTPGVAITFFDNGVQVGQVAANTSLTNGPGTSFQSFFNPTGTPSEIALAISAAINNGIVPNDRYFEATYNKDIVYVQSLFGGSRFNRLSFGIDWINYPNAQFETYPVTSNTNPSTNFVGGGDYKNAQLKVTKGDENRFSIGNFVKSKDGFAKIGNHIPYLEEPILDPIGRTIGYRGVNDNVVITLDEGNIPTTGAGQVAVYSDFRVSFGRFSFFPVKDLDFDFYSTMYSQNGELLYEETYYNTIVPGSLPIEYSGVSTNPNIREFYDRGGFTELIGLLREAQPDAEFDSVIASEYDRLEENYIKTQAVASRVVPYINKWGYYNDGRDTRNHPYRLNLSEAFTQNNFASSKYELGQKPLGFSHEWYYLCEFPPYFGTNAIEDSWSYFETAPIDSVDPNPFTGLPYIPGTFQSVTNNYFDEYFIADRFNVNNQITLIDRQLRYSRLRGGDSENFAQGFLRGVRIIVKQKALRSQKANFNANKLSYVRNSNFNNYRFSTIMVPNAINKPKAQVKFVKNEKWKTIVMMIFVNIDEECIAGGQSIDRTTLYSLKSKFKYDPECEVIELSDGSFDYKHGIMRGAINLASSGGGLILGQSDVTGNPTNFSDDITIGLDGQYTPIQFTIGADVYLISGITNIVSNSVIEAAFITRNNVPIALPYSGIPQLSLQSAEYVLIGGGYEAYISTLGDVSFAEIFRSVNLGNPEVIYETIDIDGNQVLDDDGSVSQTFSVELRAQDDITKPVYLGILPDPNKPTIFNLIDVIGYDLSLQRTPRISPIGRHSGYYEPISKELLFFRDPYLGIDFDTITGSTSTSTGGSGIPDEDYKLSVLNLMRYKNTQFFSDHVDFGQIKNMFYHKVNVEDSSSVLELSQDSAFLSLYPLINEVGIDYKDTYVFSSNWEPGYFRKSIDKTQIQSIIGTRSMTEKKSYFGSKYLNVPQEINLETFVQSEFNEEGIINSTLVDGTFMVREADANIEMYLFIQKRLISELSPSIKATFEKYVNPLYGFGDEESLNDDVEKYIVQNLLKLYKIDRIELFEKADRAEQSNDYATAGLTDLEKVDSGLRLTDNFSSKILNTNQFDTRLIYNKRLGYSESFGFNVVLIKK